MPPSFALQSLISKEQWYHSMSGVRHIDQETALMQAQRLHKGAPAQRRPFGAQLGTWDTKNSTRHRRARRVFTHSPHQASSLGFITFLQAPESRSKASASSTEAPSSTRFANAINLDNSERIIGSKR